jgi:hypothetical protein
VALMVKSQHSLNWKQWVCFSKCLDAKRGGAAGSLSADEVVQRALFFTWNTFGLWWHKLVGFSKWSWCNSETTSESYG